jgi:hypothetical protein
MTLDTAKLFKALKMLSFEIRNTPVNTAKSNAGLVLSAALKKFRKNPIALS